MKGNGLAAGAAPLTSKRKARPASKQSLIVGDFNFCEFPDCKECVVRGVKLGRYHGWNAVLAEPDKPSHPAILCIGCQQFASRAEAAAHWAGGKNPHGDPRPRARQLIAKAAEVAKRKRWKWAAIRKAEGA